MEQAIQINTRIRRSKQQIEDLLNEFEKSGSRVKDFCKLHNISTGNFHKWKSRYKVAVVKKKTRFGFAKLDVVNSSLVVPGLFDCRCWCSPQMNIILWYTHTNN